ncbi:MAG: hypothetical protein ACRDLF_12935 [Solirubrobacteraceae bacterium]
MTLLGRAPREAYRVYSEEEFFAVEDWLVEAEPDVAAIGGREPRPWGRVAGIAALTAVVTAVAGVVAFNEVRSRAGTDRRLASRKAVPGPPGDAKSAHSPPSGLAGRVLLAAAPPVVAHTHVPLRSHPAATPAVSAPVTAATPTAATAGAAATASATPTATTASTGGARPEFGFER